MHAAFVLTRRAVIQEKWTLILFVKKILSSSAWLGGKLAHCVVLQLFDPCDQCVFWDVENLSNFGHAVFAL